MTNESAVNDDDFEIPRQETEVVVRLAIPLNVPWGDFLDVQDTGVVSETILKRLREALTQRDLYLLISSIRKGE